MPVRIEGDGDAAGVEWMGNRFDDYQGYDLDGDRVGDVPYELYRLSDQLTGAHQDLRFFHGTPALALLDLAGHVFPLLAPRVLLRDPAPRTDPFPEAGVVGAH